jgi:hypothetical protein
VEPDQKSAYKKRKAYSGLSDDETTPVSVRRVQIIMLNLIALRRSQQLTEVESIKRRSLFGSVGLERKQSLKSRVGMKYLLSKLTLICGC